MSKMIGRCPSCKHETTLDESAGELFRIGLYPFRCPNCITLHPSQRIENDQIKRTYLEDRV